MGRHALLIGVSEFSDKRLARLNAPVNDVIKLKGILEDGSRGGFDTVNLGLNEDFLPTRDRLSRFFHERAPDDFALLYYSGHGILGRGNRLFLATAGSNLDAPRERSISAHKVREFMGECRAERQIIVLDCCHSGAFAERGKTGSPPPAVTAETFSSGDGGGVYILTAADTLQFAWDGGELRVGDQAAAQLSRFTSWLVDGLETGEAAPDDERITMDALYQYLSRRARSEGAASTPQRFVQGGVGDLVISANPLAGSSRIDPGTAADLKAAEYRTRLGAVTELTFLMAERGVVVARAARLLLQRHLSDERDYQVRQAISRALAEHEPNRAETGDLGHEVTPARRGTEADERSNREEVKRRGDEPSRQAQAPRVRDREEPAAVVRNQRAEAPPRVFISYSHDGLAHEDRVLALANRLRADGIDAMIDQYVQSPPQGWPAWCESEIRRSDFVLLVCTEVYLRRVDNEEEPGIGHGVMWEARLIRQHLYDAGAIGTKFVPVLFADGSHDHVPTPVRGASIHRIETTQGYEALYRLLTNQPRVRMPEIGKLVSLPERQRQWVGEPSNEPEQPSETAGPVPQQDPQRADLAVFRDAEFAPELVVIPAGEFKMGSADDEEGGYEFERPQHRVTIGRRFAIGRYPVTFDEYDRFCGAKGRNKPKDQGWGRERQPVINISWQDAQEYVAWLSQETEQAYRLLSEAEWEYVCRAGTTTRYSFGEAITPKDANYADSGLGKTSEVGAYPANRWGLHDMHGNVFEWVEDDWHENYRGAPIDGAAWKDPGSSANPHLCVLRGGSWLNDPRDRRSAIRFWIVSVFRFVNVGFRVARTLS